MKFEVSQYLASLLSSGVVTGLAYSMHRIPLAVKESQILALQDISCKFFVYFKAFSHDISIISYLRIVESINDNIGK